MRDAYWPEVDMLPEVINLNPALDSIVEFEIINSEPEPDKYPQYGVPGRILFEVYPKTEEYDLEVEIIDYDGETSMYWLSEGLGILHWIENESGIKFEGMSGKYVVVVNGRYIRGNSMWDSMFPTDDDEEWWIESGPEPTTLESLL